VSSVAVAPVTSSAFTGVLLLEAAAVETSAAMGQALSLGSGGLLESSGSLSEVSDKYSVVGSFNLTDVTAVAAAVAAAVGVKVAVAADSTSAPSLAELLRLDSTSGGPDHGGWLVDRSGKLSLKGGLGGGVSV
jgi:hypothetical protein